MKNGDRADLEALEIQLLLEAIYRRYGYDFRGYAPASLKRRVAGMLATEGVGTISGLTEKILHDPNSMKRFLIALTVNVTSMFRDPEFFVTFRQRVVPLLRTYPFLRLWHAGCSTGEEVYSMAILLQEEGLYDRCRIYATDMDEVVSKQAREGIFSLTAFDAYAENYQRAGGSRQLSDYYTSAYGSGIFRASLKDNIVFSQHNLAMDGSFNEFHVIMCRNVMIYFSQALQQRVHKLLYESLIRFGVLGLGSKETLKFTPHEADYEQLAVGCKLYRRIG
jgi:chemotaxis protein methyltransferase CheR